MKSRVAIPAALIALIALVLLPVFNSLNIAEDRNKSVLEELKAICQIAGEMTADVDSDKRIEVISSLQLQAGVTCGIYSSEREALYTSDEKETALPEDLSVPSSVNRVWTISQKDALGVQAIYAI